MAITKDDFEKVWASTSPLTPYAFSDAQYKEGWNFIGSTPPSRQMWDFLQKNNDEKMQYLLTHFDNYLPLSGGTLTGHVDITGDLSVSGAITGNVTGNVTGTATRAINDANGNPIAGTYLPLSGGNITGDLTAPTINVTTKMTAPTVYSGDNSQNVATTAWVQSIVDEKMKDDFGAPLTANTVAGMTMKNRVYVYTGSETGYTAGHWYYWNGSAWTDGGVYNAVAIVTDTTLTQAGVPADAKATGDTFTEIVDGLTVTDGEIVPSLTWTQGKYVDKTTGAITSGISDLYVSQYVPIPKGTGAVITNAQQTGVAWVVAYYDASKTYITGYTRANNNFNNNNRDLILSDTLLPSNAKYVVVTEYLAMGTRPLSDIYLKFYIYDRLLNDENNILSNSQSINAINNGNDDVALTWKNGKRLDSTGAVINGSTSFDVSNPININVPFYEIKISGLHKCSTDASVAFYDKNMHSLSREVYSANGIVTIAPNDVPSGAMYILIGHYSESTYTTSDVSVAINYSKRIDDIEDDIKEIHATVVIDDTYNNVLEGASSFTDKKFINDKGNVTGNPYFCLIDGYYPVKPNTNYKLYRGEPSLYSNAGHNWTFWDKDKHFVSYKLSGTATDGIVTSPATAAFLRFAVYISNTGSATHENFDPSNVVITEDGKSEFEDDFLNTFVTRPTLKGLKWIGVGDSITEENFRATYHYWSYIAAETGLNFVNMGVSGSGYKAEGSGNKAFYKRVQSMATDADVITIFGGVNDIVFSSATIGTATDSTTNTICGCVNATIDNIETLYPAHMPIGIISPLPCHRTDTVVNIYPYQNPNDDTCRMAQFVEQLALICKHRGIPFLDLFHSSNLRPWHSECNAKYFSCDSAPTGDGLHPNGHGHRLFYRQIMDFVQKLAMR